MEKKKKAANPKSFETALKELEGITRNLEQGDLDLEKSIQEFEKGIKLSKLCHDKLEEAERKIEILQKGGDDNINKKEIRVKKGTGEIEEDEDLQGSLL